MKNYKSYICYILDIDEETLEFVLEKSKYHTFKVPKHSGGYRTISAPDDKLKYVQEKLNDYINHNYEFLDCLYGFVRGRSIVDNAKTHQKAKYILNIDLKDFFPSIHYGRVRGVFASPPFNLDLNVASTLAKIACFQNSLPQGSPSSPAISNIVCYKLDKKMLNFCSKHNVKYTRYADDITLSSNEPFPELLVTRTSDNLVVLGKYLRKIIESNGFTINESKTNYSWNNERKEVTGLIINEKVNIKKVYLKELRALLNNCEKHGTYETAKRYFKVKCDYKTEYNKHSTLIRNFFKVIEGKLNFVGMVRGKDDLVYQKYLKQYQNIIKKNEF